MNSINRVKGVATLLITALLLMVSLIVCLGAYKNVLFQIKRASNEVDAGKERWKAEGGIECAYAMIARDGDLTKLTTANSPAYFNSECTSTMGLNKLTASQTQGTKYSIVANLKATDGHKLTKSFKIDDGSGKGALQTNASIKFISDHNIAIDPDVDSSGTATTGEYECVALRFGDTVIYERNIGKLITETPGSAGQPASFPSDFSNCQEKTDLSSNATAIRNQRPNNTFASDYVFDPNVDPFFNFFQVEKTAANITALKSGYHVASVNGTQKCGEIIVDLFDSYDKVWLVGDCMIHTPFTIADLPGTVTRRSLVLQDGVFASFGASVFDGALFHMVDMSMFHDSDGVFDPSALAAHWAATDPHATPLGLVESNSIYVDFGSFFPKGGISFDFPGGLTTIQGSVNHDFRGTYNPHDKVIVIDWLEGSWNDL